MVRQFFQARLHQRRSWQVFRVFPVVEHPLNEITIGLTGDRWGIAVLVVPVVLMALLAILVVQQFAALRQLLVEVATDTGPGFAVEMQRHTL